MTTEFVTAPSTPEGQAPRRDALEIAVEQRLGQDDGGVGGMTIFRVPAHVREANKELYEPRLVSIGPYYRGRESLRAMEQHKWRYLRELVARRPEASLADYVGAVRDVEPQARRCYSERTNINSLDAAASASAQGEPSGGGMEDGHSPPAGCPMADHFAGMLLLDGCFILQFFIKWYNHEPDELCDVGWGLPLLLSDMMLLENQIPFFVLEALFRVVTPAAERLDLRKLILPHLRFNGYTFKDLSTSNEAKVPIIEIEISHLLHLFYEALVPKVEEGMVFVTRRTRQLPQCLVQLGLKCVRFKMAVSKMCVSIGGKTDGDPQPAPPPLIAPSVTMLCDAGVRFKKKPSRNMFDITFIKAKGVMWMPHFEVDQANMPLLVNLIAFEHTRDLRGIALKLSSYTALISSLVRTGKDVEQLQKRGIVDNLLDRNEDVATSFFQRLARCSYMDYEEHIFADMFTELNKYYKSSWHKHKAKFLRDHCSSPWTTIALVVSVFTFCFSLFLFSSGIYNFFSHTRPRG